jgi:hypothetical protein
VRTGVSAPDQHVLTRLRTARQKQIDNKLAVEDANRKFYDAFNSGDFKVVFVHIMAPAYC